MLLLLFFAIVWLRIDHDEHLLNEKAGMKQKPPNLEDFPVIYKGRC